MSTCDRLDLETQLGSRPSMSKNPPITIVDVSKIMSTIRVEIVNGWNEIWWHIQCPKTKTRKDQRKLRIVEPGFFEPRNGAYDLARRIPYFGL